MRIIQGELILRQAYEQRGTNTENEQRQAIESAGQEDVFPRGLGAKPQYSNLEAR